MVGYFLNKKVIIICDKNDVLFTIYFCLVSSHIPVPVCECCSKIYDGVQLQLLQLNCSNWNSSVYWKMSIDLFGLIAYFRYVFHINCMLCLEDEIQAQIYVLQFLHSYCTYCSTVQQYSQTTLELQ